MIKIIENAEEKRNESLLQVGDTLCCWNDEDVDKSYLMVAQLNDCGELKKPYTIIALNDTDEQCSATYEEMDDDAELIADVDEVDSFHIGYGHFNFLRKELGELVGIRYDDSDVFNTSIYYDDCYKNTSLLNFFLHSDCDGEFSTDEIQESYEQFTKYCDEEMLREKKAGKWAEEINSFLKFWKESADKKLQWEFC